MVTGCCFGCELVKKNICFLRLEKNEIMLKKRHFSNRKHLVSLMLPKTLILTYFETQLVKKKRPKQHPGHKSPSKVIGQEGGEAAKAGGSSSSEFASLVAKELQDQGEKPCTEWSTSKTSSTSSGRFAAAAASCSWYRFCAHIART